VDKSENFREQRRLEYPAALAPFVGLAGTMYGIIRAFERLDGLNPENTVLRAIIDALIFTAICIPILFLVLLAWDWLFKK
jgi:biopolymer transport protein ExbB/TolQ